MSVVDFCAELLRIESTPGNERRAVERAAQEMADLGYDDVRIDEHGNLLGRIGPEDGRPVLVLDAHIDTIPLHAEAWTYDPLGAQIADGVMYGLGASDMKGPVAAIVHGGARVKKSDVALRGTLFVVASISEEMMEGATLDRSFADVPVDYCVIAEATGLTIATAQRGRAKVEVEVRGHSVHAANARLGVNAAEIAAEVVRGARELPSGYHPLLGKRDVNLIDIRSEPYPSVNTIPNYCLARFDVRFLPGETKEGLLDTFRGLVPPGAEADVRYYRARWQTYVGEGFEVDEFAASWETSRDHEIVRAAEEATGAELSAYQFCTNGSYFAGSRGIPTIGFGPAFPEEAHTPDESIPVDHLERAAESYRDIVLALLT